MPTVRLRCFASAREAAGTGSDTFEADDLDGLLAAARARYGPSWADVAAHSRVWINGDEPAEGTATLLHAGDEVAVLPPVSGGADG